VSLFTLMRFLRGLPGAARERRRLSVGFAPMTLVVMSATYMLTAYPVGYLADRMSRPLLLSLGCAVMVAPTC
jgi:hypothetical protein